VCGVCEVPVLCVVSVLISFEVPGLFGNIQMMRPGLFGLFIREPGLFRNISMGTRVITIISWGPGLFGISRKLGDPGYIDNDVIVRGTRVISKFRRCVPGLFVIILF
jgi:hypothetical protein